jgi:hypothetical protein
MTKEIRKYTLDSMDDLGYTAFVRADLPKGAKIINISYSAGYIFLHAIVNPEHKKKERWFAIFKEGTIMEDYEKKTFEYVGMIGDNLHHVFEVHD